MTVLKNKYFLSLLLSLLLLAADAQTIQRVKVTELDKLIKESQTPLLINFWATFCKPCIGEIPYLLKISKEYEADSLTLILVSLDLEESYPEKISAFIDKRKINSRVVWLDEFDADYFCPVIDPAWSGAIPATLFVNNKTGHRRFIEAALSEVKLRAMVKELTGN